MLLSVNNSMSIIKTINSKRVIPIDMFSKCLIDNVTKSNIVKMYPGRINGPYYIDKFINYIKDEHNCSIIYYVENLLKEPWPKCPSKNIHVGYRSSGKGLILSDFSRGGVNKETCKKFKDGCEKLSIERMGDGNPMFNKKPWNKGLGVEDERVAKMTRHRLGFKASEETKKKQSKIRQNHPLKARHTQKHSDESKQKMRDATISRWKNGDFSFKKTSIEKIVENWLINNGFNFQYQFGIGNFIADFVNEDERLIIECNGDYFHCNPNSKYKNPIHEVQKRNAYRDELKRKFYKENNWTLIELWENEINSGEFKKILKCKLKK